MTHVSCGFVLRQQAQQATGNVCEVARSCGSLQALAATPTRLAKPAPTESCCLALPRRLTTATKQTQRQAQKDPRTQTADSASGSAEPACPPSWLGWCSLLSRIYQEQHMLRFSLRLAGLVIKLPRQSLQMASGVLKYLWCLDEEPKQDLAAWRLQSSALDDS